MTAPRLRPAEWILAGYFTYVAVLTFFFPSARARGSEAWLLASAAACVLILVARLPGAAVSMVRDWLPFPLTLVAYRQMDWFTPTQADHTLDLAFIPWDRWLLSHGFRAAVEATGFLLPALLEAAYLLVYVAAPIALVILIAQGKRKNFPRWWIAYLAGTLGAYALLPFFPSQPPRTAFAGSDLPSITTWLRQLNLAIVGSYGIHSSVFPSAHVSSTFSAAWGLRATLPERPGFGRAMAVYATLVGVATVYGRYHYAADVVAGFAVSLISILALRLSRAPGIGSARGV